MITTCHTDGTHELSVTYSLLGRVLGFMTSGIAGISLILYFRSQPDDPLEITITVLFFAALFLLGLSLLRTRLLVGRQFIENRGLFWKRTVALPKETTVGRSGRFVVLRDPAENTVYQFDPNFNHGNRLEADLRVLFSTDSDAAR